jgi:hypothetical protein
MRVGRAWDVCVLTAPASCAWRGGVRPWTSGSSSGLIGLADTISEVSPAIAFPVRVRPATPTRPRVRLDVVVRDRPVLPESIGAQGTADIPVTTGLTVASFVSRGQAPLLRFASPSALTGRAALSEVADLRTIPLRRFATGPHVRTSRTAFAPAVSR